jgi:hypothetical protein
MVIDPNWPRIRRWCLLGAVVMLLWLAAPIARCSWAAFRDEPLNEAMPHDAQDNPRPDRSFFSRWGSAIEGCYASTPLLGQEPWKRNVLFALLGLALLSHVASLVERRKKGGYG